MDCVVCEKCRLWGKLQISGLGTALKILFSYRDSTKDYELSRTEVVALINGFGRLSNSLEQGNMFKQMNYTRTLERQAQAQKVVAFIPFVCILIRFV